MTNVEKNGKKCKKSKIFERKKTPALMLFKKRIFLKKIKSKAEKFCWMPEESLMDVCDL